MEEERIERYLQDQMDPEEKQAFESEMSNNADLAESVRLQKAIMKGFTDQKVEDFRTRIFEIEGASQRKVKDVKFHKPILWIAASFIALLVVQQTLFSGFDMQDHYEPYPNYIFPQERGEDTGSDLEKAFVAYENGDYSSAMETFNTEAPSDTIRFYKAQCQIALGEESKAIETLTPLVEDANGIFHQQSLWYLSLLYLENGDEEKAKVLLENLVETQGFKSKEAGELLGSL